MTTELAFSPTEAGLPPPKLLWMNSISQPSAAGGTTPVSTRPEGWHRRDEQGLDLGGEKPPAASLLAVPTRAFTKQLQVDAEGVCLHLSRR